MILEGELTYLRPLQPEDGLISFSWRNDPSIWEFTGNRPSETVTAEMECSWINTVLLRSNEKRFAIIKKAGIKYVGNVQLTGINTADAEYHIFIGDKESWGQGIAVEATSLILKYAFLGLHLNTVYLNVKRQNVRAIKSYVNAGFTEKSEREGLVRMLVERNFFEKQSIN